MVEHVALQRQSGCVARHPGWLAGCSLRRRSIGFMLKGVIWGRYALWL
jgi:hypothetical protein